MNNSEIQNYISSVFGDTDIRAIGNAKREDVQFFVDGVVSKPTGAQSQRVLFWPEMKEDENHPSGYKMSCYVLVRVIANEPERKNHNGMTAWIMSAMPTWKIGMQTAEDPIYMDDRNRVNNNNIAQIEQYLKSPAINSMMVVGGTFSSSFVPAGPETTQEDLVALNNKARALYALWLYGEEMTGGGMVLMPSGKVMKFTRTPKGENEKQTMSQANYKTMIVNGMNEVKKMAEELIAQKKLAMSSVIYASANTLQAAFFLPTGMGLPTEGLTNSVWSNPMCPTTYAPARLHARGVVNTDPSKTVDEKHPDYTYGINTTYEKGNRFYRGYSTVPTLDGKNINLDLIMYDIGTNKEDGRSRADLFMNNMNNGALNVSGKIGFRHTHRSTGSPWIQTAIVTVDSYRVSDAGGIVAPSISAMQGSDEDVDNMFEAPAEEVAEAPAFDVSAFANMADAQIEDTGNKGNTGRGRGRRRNEEVKEAEAQDDPLADASE